MGISRREFIGACLAMGAGVSVGCSSGPRLFQERWYVFGTLVDVTVTSDDAESVRKGMARLAGFFRDAHSNWHAWKPGRLLRVNQAIAQGREIAVDEGIEDLVRGAQLQYQLSEGAFNPAIGRIVGLWGFHDDMLPTGAPPARTLIERWVESAPNPTQVAIHDGNLHSSNPAVQFDFGGYAKGYALDAGMALLKASGVSNAVINAGGDLNAAGHNNARPWRVGVRHPQREGVIAGLEVAGDEAVYTSGNYERFRENNGQRYPHILDPCTGMPADSVASATVVHRSGAAADAAATAFVAAGPGRWSEVAQAMRITQAMLVTKSGSIELTPEMAQRIQLSARHRRRSVVI